MEPRLQKNLNYGPRKAKKIPNRRVGDFFNVLFGHRNIRVPLRAGFVDNVLGAFSRLVNKRIGVRNRFCKVIDAGNDLRDDIGRAFLVKLLVLGKVVGA